ncbi:Uncharacterised protein [Mycobacteroides abscessus]|nr:Uncharacterised protein [Mycobacteroides abscessus]SHW44246.1 Uncharacterised protein [Mycobacteroides abscessus subsp. abscessus]SKV21281.1 Uncharacterised protein [Mycobacteroides abscessus subsp. abscessus]
MLAPGITEVGTGPVDGDWVGTGRVDDPGVSVTALPFLVSAPPPCAGLFAVVEPMASLPPTGSPESGYGRDGPGELPMTEA